MATAPTSVGELIMLPPEMLEEVMKACEMHDLLQLEVTCRLLLNASRQSEQLWAYVLTLRQPVEAHALLQFARSREFCRAFSYRLGRSPWVTEGEEDLMAFAEPEHAGSFDYQILMTVGNYSGLMEWGPRKGHVMIEHGTDDLDLQLRLPATAEFEDILDPKDPEDFNLMTSVHILNLSEDLQIITLWEDETPDNYIILNDEMPEMMRADIEKSSDATSGDVITDKHGELIIYAPKEIRRSFFRPPPRSRTTKEKLWFGRFQATLELQPTGQVLCFDPYQVSPFTHKLLLARIEFGAGFNENPSELKGRYNAEKLLRGLFISHLLE
tara:strand:+ start:101 stop:1078 length:978 start_codon:yes stop_codon:yes gene_type:complete